MEQNFFTYSGAYWQTDSGNFQSCFCYLAWALHSHYRHTAGRIYAGKISVFSCPERTDGNRIWIFSDFWQYRVLRVLRDSSRRNYTVSKQTLFKKRGAKPTPLYKNDPVFKNSLSKTRSLFHLAYVQQIQYEYPCGLSSSWIWDGSFTGSGYWKRICHGRLYPGMQSLTVLCIFLLSILYKTLHNQ